MFLFLSVFTHNQTILCTWAGEQVTEQKEGINKASSDVDVAQLFSSILWERQCSEHIKFPKSYSRLRNMLA